MGIAELIEIALANSDGSRVEVAALEPAEIGMEAVSALSQLIAELVENALAFSGPGDTVRITGLHEQGHYLLSISDRGVGIPEHLITELNRSLENADLAATEPRPGIAMVARLAARHGIDVRLVPGAPGTTARVTVPGRLVTQGAAQQGKTTTGHRLPPRDLPDVFASSADEVQTVDLTRFDKHRVGSGVVAMSEEGRRQAEVFLERVFGPLRDNPGITVRPPSRAAKKGNGHAAERPPAATSPTRSEPDGTVTNLRMRVPGENFVLVEDVPSTMAAEAAIDIKSALDSYQSGRRSAEQTAGDD